MYKKVIAAAVAAMLGQAAFAADHQTTQVEAKAAQNAGRIIYLAGASATKNSFELAFKKICDTYVSGSSTLSTEHLFTFLDSTGSTGNVRAYACRLLPAASLNALGFSALSAWGGQDIVVDHSVFNGSLTSILGMDTKTANQNPQIDFNGAFTGDAASSAPPHQSAGGFSDVEAALFQDVLDSTSFNNPGVKSNLVVTSTSIAQSFGVVVSRSLYAALQSAQGLTASGCTADNITPACQPNITRSQYASLVAGQSAGSIADWGVLGLGSAPDGKVRIARRDKFSGTQASSNNFFLGRRCSVGGLDPAGAGDSTSTLIVTESVTTGNALTTLSDASNWAIGVVSLENKATAGSYAGGGKWRYLKLDGVAISDDTNTAEGSVGNGKHRQSTIDMQYGFTFETTVNTSADTSITSPIAGDLLLGLAKLMADPSVTDLVGLYVLPNADTGTLFTNATNPTQVSKAVRGGSSCQPNLYLYL
jgi:hypothetical protein